MEEEKLNKGDTESTRSGRDEMNLAEYPFALLSIKPIKGLKTIEYTDWITVNGERKLLKWTVTGSDAFGLPIGGDQDIYIAVMEAWRESGFKDRVIPLRSIYNILKRLGLPDDKRRYERFKSALDRLTTASIIAENAFWDSSNQCYISRRVFHIFDEYHLIERARKNENETPVHFGYIKVNDFFFQSVKNGYLKAIDIDFYISLSTPLTKRIYRYLDKKRYSNHTFSIELTKFAKKLGLLGGQIEKYYPSKIKQLITPPINELKDKGFIKSCSFSKIRNNGDEMIKFVFNGTKNHKDSKINAENYEAQAIADEIIEITGDPHSRNYYLKIASTLDSDLIYKALSETRDAYHRGIIKTTKAKYFTSLISHSVTPRNIAK